MKKHEKRYHKFLHLYLTKHRLNPEQFNLVTQLTAQEIKAYFSMSSYQIKCWLTVLSRLMDYQRSKQTPADTKWQLIAQQQSRQLCLWSDCLGLFQLPEQESDLPLALALLAQHDKKQATIWALRLKTALSEASVQLKSPARLPMLMNKIMAE